MTSKLSPRQQESARKQLQIVLHALAGSTLSPVADAVGSDVSSLSRWKTERFPQLAEILAALELKIVPAGAMVYAADDIQALLHLSRRSLEGVTPESLSTGAP